MLILLTVGVLQGVLRHLIGYLIVHVRLSPLSLSLTPSLVSSFVSFLSASALMSDYTDGQRIPMVLTRTVHE